MSNIPFKVIRGEEASILNKIKNDGALYFATDTGKIYMDTSDKEKILMGGGSNSGIFYAEKAFTDPSDLSFNIEDLNGDDLPNEDDLIINYSASIGGDATRDGFYRVILVDKENQSVLTTQLPVGGGTGTGNGDSSGGSVVIEYVTPDSGVGATLIDEDYILEYNIIAKDNSGSEIIEAGTAVWYINGTKIDGGSVRNGKNTFNVKNYLDSRKEINSIRLVVTFVTGGGTTAITGGKNWQITAINLSVDWDYVFPQFIETNTFNINFTPYGGIDMTAHLVFDDNYSSSDTVIEKALSASESSRTNGFYDIPKLSHGSHKATLWLSAEINGVEYTTSKISHEIACIDKTSVIPVITTDFYQETASQWDTISIPYAVWAGGAATANINIYVENELVTKDKECNAKEAQTFDYTLGLSGNVSIRFESGSATPKEFTLEVSAIALGDTKEPEGCKFKLKASEINDNADLLALQDEGLLSFSDEFDWANGGLQKDEYNDTEVKCICIKNHSYMDINYTLFGSQVNKTNGQTFKIIFKATNCYDYEAPVLSCGDSEKDSTYLDFNAQTATFKSTSIISAPYCENTLIEIETEIQKSTSGYMMFWLDGIPCAVRKYSSNDSFKQVNPSSIRIGSDYCDVYVYLVKIYERQLSDIEHLDNFILDALTPQEMLERFNRNDVISNGDISWEKVIQKNPNCHIYLYDLPDGMTTDKKNKKTCTFTEYYKDSETARYKAEGAKIYVQGTSSADYGVAAFNLRTSFDGATLTDGEGNAVEGYQIIVDDDAKPAEPINLTCAKVNVASCENANNALNAEWYNKFQPYYDIHRRKKILEGKYDPRDCMGFNFGLLFMRDYNETSSYGDSISTYVKANLFADTTNYIKSPYYKQYSICNFGNDKKNSAVFHDVDDNPNCCCVENKNNQTIYNWLATEITDKELEDSDYATGDKYEFRYPDGNDLATQTHRDAWKRFVNWICKLDPHPYDATKHPFGYTNETIPEETYGSYKIKGFRPTGYGTDTDSPYNTSLAGTTISNYAGTYTTDCYERRIAKMLSECEDYLVLDSLVYHYLFILRHTMVDNVAKNTFWSTEDGLHWDLTKNYDNDTADGNDNNGDLTFTYGKEIGDSINGVSIFNGSDSVWLAFIDALGEAQEAMYRKLDAVQAWDAETYLKLFKEKQNVIPERCWIYDYQRKYIRPQQLGLDGDGAYLARLDGGKKTHQREAYEKYQEVYIRSKLGDAATLQKTSITSRFNAKEGDNSWANTKLKVKHYIDIYPRAEVGGSFWKGERTPRPTSLDGYVEVPVGEMITSAADATFYFYNGEYVTAIENMANAYPTFISVGNAKKLRSLEIGSDDPEYRNEKLETLNLETNTMLETVLAQNSGPLENSKLQAFEAPKTKSLKTLDLSGSTFTGITLADGALVEVMKIPAIENLDIKNLTKLTEVSFDEGIDKTLKTISVDNCPAVDTYKLVSEAINLNSYCLLNIDWNITDNSLSDGSLINIDVLDKLKNLNPITEDSRTSLSGKIKIDLSSAFNVDEYAIWEKYHSIYPNVEFSYGETAEIVYAKKIIFLENDEDNSPELFTVLTDGTKTIATLISVDGPAGEAIGQPAKAKTNEFEYYWNIDSFTLTGSEVWEDYEWECNGTKYRHSDNSFLTLIPTTSMTFKPLFSQKYRQYKVDVKVQDSSIEGFPKSVSYNTILSDIPIYYYRAHSDTNKRYEFFGWISAKDYLSGNSNPTFITDFTITSDLTLYAYYKEQDVETTVSRDDYFTITERKISLNSKYKDLLKGPITLPCSSSLTIVGDFRGSHGITDIYFMPQNNSYTTVTGSAFEDTNIQNIYFASGIQRIDNAAFQDCKQLVNLGGLSSSSLTEIKTTAFYNTGSINLNLNDAVNLTSLGSSSTFYQAGAGVELDGLPKGITSLCSFNFYNCPNVRIEDFTNVESMGSTGSSYPCLNGCGKNGAALKIILPSAYLSNYCDGCFEGYAVNNIDSVTFEDGSLVSSEELSRIGLSYSNPTTVELVY